MGQQQLLLLVLSTVIVGLATVAGIQAFSENQAQATQDALVQRGTSIMSDLKGLGGKPSQMGGIDLSGTGNDSPDVTSTLKQLGYEPVGSSSTKVPVDGAAGSESSSNSDLPANCEVLLDGPGNVDGTSVVARANCNSNETDQEVRVGLTSDGEVVTEFN